MSQDTFARASERFLSATNDLDRESAAQVEEAKECLLKSNSDDATAGQMAAMSLNSIIKRIDHVHYLIYTCSSERAVSLRVGLIPKRSANHYGRLLSGLVGLARVDGGHRRSVSKHRLSSFGTDCVSNSSRPSPLEEATKRLTRR